MNTETNKGVFVIYTGGTIGSRPRDPNDPDSPRTFIAWDELVELTPALNDLDFPVTGWSFPTPTDSCNIGPREWRLMAEKIEVNYDSYEGFVILHGTDTMVYTASVLSFMLVNLGKPVILTGGQRSHLYQARNDAEQNLITALRIANPKDSGIPVVPEVCIFFRDDLYRGNRCIKEDASGYNAYSSPNYPHLGWAGDKIHIDTRHIRPIPTQSFRIRRNMNSNVISFNVFPGIQDTDVVQRLLNAPNLRGIILCTFGSGNIPTSPDFLEPFREAVERGVIIQSVTQCTRGMVDLGLYESSARLLEIGIISGLDITDEAALCKMMVLLGDEDLTEVEVADLMQQDLEGEMSLSVFTTHFRKQDKNRLNASQKSLRLVSVDFLPGDWKGWKISSAVFRFRKARIKNDPLDEPVSIRIFLNLGSTDILNDKSPNYAGEFRRMVNDEPSIVSFDVTKVARRLFKPGMKVSFTISIGEDSQGSFEWDSAEFCIYSGSTVDSR
ncbi:asparaginase [bacterium]|nr:asparaginase [bacterium]